jgi:hypothetical protein
VLGVLAVPPAHVEAGAPTGDRPWAYFSKFGIDVRAGSPAVLITVPRTWRRRAAIGWGNNASGVSSLRLLSCPQQLAPWNGYAGGFFLLSASGCVPFRQRVWLPALRAAELPLIHFHDLRHTGNNLAADAGAGLRELMERMGHSTTRAALTYLHAGDQRQRAIAEALSEISKSELKRRGSAQSGTQRARKRRSAS